MRNGIRYNAKRDPRARRGAALESGSGDMFGSIGMQELIIIFVIALIIFGPRRLPDLGKSLGRSIAEFKRASNELRNTLEEEIRVDDQRQAQGAATTPAPAATPGPAATESTSTAATDSETTAPAESEPSAAADSETTAVPHEPAADPRATDHTPVQPD
jgi:TatA/E family protein of Tat protein translocase